MNCKFFFILLITLSACSSENQIDTVDTNNQQQFLSADVVTTHLESETEVMDVEINTPLHILQADKDLLVVVDSPSWNINLMNHSGSIIDSAGGSGAGPGEFNLINSVHIIDGNRLLVLDRRLLRVTIYGLKNDRFRLHEVKNTDAVKDYSIEDIYVVDGQWYGVLQKRAGETRDYELHTLDRNLNTTGSILTFPGNERITVNGRSTENPLGKGYYWDFDGSWFFYSDKQASELVKVNLSDLSQKTIQVENRYLPSPFITDENRENLKERLLPMKTVQPKLYEEMTKQNSFPRIGEFSVQHGLAVFIPFYTLNEDNEALILKMCTGENFLIPVPAHTYKMTIKKDEIIGVNAENEQEKITLQKIILNRVIEPCNL